MRRMTLPLIALLLTAGTACTAEAEAPPPRDPLTVETTAGTVRGVHSGAVDRYLGIPYAAPPTGDRRWTPPQPPGRWSGVRPADRHQKACAQGATRPATSEDCLYVDVTAPAGRRGRPKPVLVWLHGGGFSEGAGVDYDPSRLAAQGDLVVVTVDFRLGVFGFFAPRGVAGSGTYGLLDQQAALRWVRDEIAGFGGDPGRVTLAGQSGGAIGACAQLTAPSSAGLFHRVILQSASCDTEIARDSSPTGNPRFRFWRPLADVERTSEDAAAALGCRGDDSLACLRALPDRAFDKQYPLFGSAAFGTPLLPRDPREALHAGAAARVPVLAGVTRDEHRLTAGLFALAGWQWTAAGHTDLMTRAFGDRAGEVLGRYPATGDGALAWAAVFTDRMWVCPQVAAATALAGTMPVYTYEFADPRAQPVTDLPAGFPAGASHGSELPMLFEVAGRQPLAGARYDDAQRRLAGSMVERWAAFARTGRPAEEAAWPRLTAGATTLRLAPDGPALIDLAAAHQCAFWRTVPA
ncbi:carboxylesterase/lipase family protein [Actinoplanes sp. RD1]|uniref:carboxylesterase/lipase family protein n=1 Tax=Actinoplanes sp. RD1 TaxID=3064538 RepID=UPI0027413D6B|nr:carboxylesterase family protein [Actinoplanes sp. RD1]